MLATLVNPPRASERAAKIVVIDPRKPREAIVPCTSGRADFLKYEELSGYGPWRLHL
jgi:hypothetical protein